MDALITFAAGLLGLAVGSFVNVVVARVPEGHSVVSPPSRCPGCGDAIRPRDNVPVVSWLLLRGRCRSCAIRIPARYPVVELVTAILFVSAARRLGADPALAAFWSWGSGLVALSAIDLERFILPNKVLYPTLALCTAALIVAAAIDGGVGGTDGGLVGSVIGGLVGYGVIFAIWFASPRGMGYGDVRLSGLNGVLLGWLGPWHVGVGLFAGFLLASVVGIALLLSGRKTRKDPIPFGPFLAAGAWAAFLWGRPVLAWYGVGG